MAVSARFALIPRNLNYIVFNSACQYYYIVSNPRVEYRTTVNLLVISKLNNKYEFCFKMEYS